MIKDTYYFASPDKSPTQFIEAFETFYGPTMNAMEAARKNGKAEELHNQLVELANAQNKSKDAGTLFLQRSCGSLLTSNAKETSKCRFGAPIPRSTLRPRWLWMRRRKSWR